MIWSSITITAKLSSEQLNQDNHFTTIILGIKQLQASKHALELKLEFGVRLLAK